ncbi:Plant protein of unknown function (DUF247) [Melia azedarach]|uniref:Uncharacterized protein n=1 Tax=Melia azedarach TaxID=155640 RepID=A0ACC1Y6A9_MELAZ|nr:Plant protein of unknown function (DUF247) [Melia azedarach]
MSSNPNQNFDEHRWIINIRRTLEEELENHTEIPVCIFNVPKPLMSSDPDSYTPQEVAIGPYHYWRPELYEMERYKLAAAKRAQRQFQGDHKFQYVVNQLKELELQIRDCYHKFLNFSNETLAWMMAIDASFLLEFLQIYAMKEGKISESTSSSRSMSHLVDYAGTKAAHNAILRDMVMLENQIPLFVLRKMLEVQYSSLESADDMLQAMLMGFCEEISPFKMMKDMATVNVSECSHLLDYLYDGIVPKDEQQAEITEIEDQERAMQAKERYYGDPTYVKKFFHKLWKLLSKLNKGPIRLIKVSVLSKPVRVLFKLPWTMISKIPRFSVLAQPLQYLIFPQDNEGKKSDDVSSHSSNNMNKPPLVEEIAIPSVTDLYKSKVRFSATVGNISTVSFDPKTATLYLPTMSLDINSEVIMRNLVAYEASNASGPLVFTRYTELMNGIIDTEEDVRLLRGKGIILNRLKSDTEVANLWNGMNKSIRLTKVPHLDKVIEDVNKYYDSQWKVKFGKYLKIYVFGSWQFLTLIATILLLVLMIWQAFCSVYNCRKLNLLGSDSD